MRKVIGVYLGWVSPDSGKWEPLLRTVRCEGGYKSERTQLYAKAVEKYPGLERPLRLPREDMTLPYVLRTRIPVETRSDIERKAHFLGLSSSAIDLFEWVGRNGGLVTGDLFSTCPIVESDENNEYSYECLLWKVDPGVQQGLNDDMKLMLMTQEGRATMVLADSQKLGELPPYFSGLENNIFKIRLVNIAKEYLLGCKILISFTTPIAIYNHSDFKLEAEEAVSV